MILNKIWTPKEVADRFGISELTILEWRKEGMPTVKIRKMIFIREQDFNKWFEKMAKSQNAQDALG